MTLGADNAGRPYYQLYGRTANVLSWLATDTSYNSLQAKLDRRFRNGFLVTTSYTLGRAINYSEETGVATPADLERSKGRPDFDRTHVVRVELHLGHAVLQGRTTSALHWVLGGWQVSGIFTAYSGTPINFTASAATLAPRTTPSGRTSTAATPRSSATSGRASSTSTRRSSRRPRRTPGAT